jgi:hypothetical protein
MLAAATYVAGALEPWVALIVFVTIGSSNCVAVRCWLLLQIVDMLTAATYLAGAHKPWMAVIPSATISSL